MPGHPPPPLQRHPGSKENYNQSIHVHSRLHNLVTAATGWHQARENHKIEDDNWSWKHTFSMDTAPCNTASCAVKSSWSGSGRPPIFHNKITTSAKLITLLLVCKKKKKKSSFFCSINRIKLMHIVARSGQQPEWLCWYRSAMLLPSWPVRKPFGWWFRRHCKILRISLGKINF